MTKRCERGIEISEEAGGPATVEFANHVDGCEVCRRSVESERPKSKRFPVGTRPDGLNQAARLVCG